MKWPPERVFQKKENIFSGAVSKVGVVGWVKDNADQDHRSRPG